MTDTAAFVAWLGTPSTSAAPAAASPATPAPVAPADRVAAYITNMNAAAAAKPNPLFPDRDPNDQPPAKSGNPVTDHIARQHWLAGRAANPLRPRR